MLHLFARILVANIHFYADNQLDAPHILTDAAHILEQNSADVIGLFLLHVKDIIQNERLREILLQMVARRFYRA